MKLVLRTQCALFLDFDGTLVDFAPTPAEVRVGPRLIGLLTQLGTTLHGSVAVITGRSIESIDQLLRPLRLAVAGLHGLERRSSDGTLYRANTPAWVAATRLALAVHYRQAPQHERATRDLMTCMTANLAGAAQLQAGPASLEIRPPGHGKGGAVAHFLRAAPFCGREPLYIGDDETDLPAMRVAEAHRGSAIAVGSRISAPRQFPGPAALLDWLQDL